MSSFPSDIKVYLNDIDITYYIFGTDSFTSSPSRYIFRNIDLTNYISTDGIHEIRITTGSQTQITDGDTIVQSGEGRGRVDCRVEIA